jgi:hypothetical protein
MPFAWLLSITLIDGNIIFYLRRYYLRMLFQDLNWSVKQELGALLNLIMYI